MTIEMTRTARGTQTPRLRGANIDRISAATRRAVLGNWTPAAEIEKAQAHMDNLEREAEEADLLDLVPVTAPEPTERKATPGMRTLLTRLREERATTGQDVEEISFKDARTEIDRLIATPRAAKPTAGAVKIEDGVYLFEGEYYMVQHAVHGSGHQYAKRILAPEKPGQRATSVYAAGIVLKLRPEMKLSADQAARFGKVYRCCVQCFRPLTDDRSKAAGYGQKCADNNGWPWG